MNDIISNSCFFLIENFSCYGVKAAVSWSFFVKGIFLSMIDVDLQGVARFLFILGYYISTLCGTDNRTIFGTNITTLCGTDSSTIYGTNITALYLTDSRTFSGTDSSTFSETYISTLYLTDSSILCRSCIS